MLRSFRFWDGIADHYDALIPTAQGRAESALVDALRLAMPAGVEPLRVLDIGAGTGRAVRAIRAAAGARRLQVTLMDGSAGMLRHAERTLGDDVVYACAGAVEDDASWAALGDAKFDVVVASFALHYLSNVEKLRLFARVERIVRRGIVAILARVTVSGFGGELARLAAARWDDPLTAELRQVEPADRPAEHLASVDAHLQWLTDAGFEGACIWREHDTALLLAKVTSAPAFVDARPPEERHVGRPRVFSSVLEAIGNTPLVSLDRFCREEALVGRILLKLEYYNPGASKKDRVAYEMVRAARAEGRLAPGQMVVELTSGNTGTGLAIACGVLGHPFVAVMSEGNSVERTRMMVALGARVVLVPQAAGSTPGKVSGADLALVDQRARELVDKHGAFRTDQFELPANPASHEHGTGMEILRQTSGAVTAFVDFVGSAGTLAGVSRTLKAWSAAIACYGIEPAGAAFLAGEPITRPNHKIQGGGYARRLSFFDPAICDGLLKVDDEEAIAAARALARLEGVFGGFSTGANVAAAAGLLRGRHRGGTVVCVAPDSGLKYLSTDLYLQGI